MGATGLMPAADRARIVASATSTFVTALAAAADADSADKNNDYETVCARTRVNKGDSHTRAGFEEWRTQRVAKIFIAILSHP